MLINKCRFTFVDESSMSNHFAHRESSDDEDMHIDEDAIPPGSDDEMDDVRNGVDDDILGDFD